MNIEGQFLFIFPSGVKYNNNKIPDKDRELFNTFQNNSLAPGARKEYPYTNIKSTFCRWKCGP